MFKKILIPLDGTMRAEQALGLVGKIFQANESQLILLEATNDPHLAYPLYGSGVDGYIQIIPDYKNEKADEYVQSVAQGVRTWLPNVQAFSVKGKADEAIVNVAIQEEVDLIVMVTHGRAGLARLLFGSVTEMVVRDAPCPVFAIRDGHLPEHMLIAVDGTPFSETILDPAFAFAKLINADVTLARVDVPAEDVDMREVAEIRKIDEGLADSLLYNNNMQSSYYLDDLMKRYEARASELKINLDYDLDYGPAGTQLPKIAERNKCDLIAMATHGRKGLDRFWNRSTTEDVMHHTQTAMFILHPSPAEINI